MVGNLKRDSLISYAQFSAPTVSVPRHPIGRQVGHQLVCGVGRIVHKPPLCGIGAADNDFSGGLVGNGIKQLILRFGEKHLIFSRPRQLLNNP